MVDKDVMPTGKAHGQPSCLKRYYAIAKTLRFPVDNGLDISKLALGLTNVYQARGVGGLLIRMDNLTFHGVQARRPATLLFPDDLIHWQITFPSWWMFCLDPAE